MSNLEYASISSDRDGRALNLLLCLPDTEPKAIVQLAHGMCENKERYLPFMEFLAENGYICAILDHRGHGELAREKGELGYFGQDGAQALVDDMYQLTKLLKSRFPDQKLYLFGHSMGSLAARVYSTQFESELSGLIVSGSPSYNSGAPLGRLLAKVLAIFKGEKKRSNLLKAMTLGGFYRAFAHENSKCAWICSDKAVVRAYEASPLCGFTFTINGFESLYSLMIAAYDTRKKTKNPTLPVLFISGKEDPCRSGEKGFSHAINAMKQRGYQSVQAKLYDGMRHEILNEPNRLDVYRDVLEMLEQCGGRQ